MQIARFGVLVLLLVLLAAPHTLTAQILEGFDLRGIEANDPSQPPSPRKARQDHLNDLIELIQKHCDLTDKQLRRLQVASKGAVEYSLRGQTPQVDTAPKREALVHLGARKVRAMGLVDVRRINVPQSVDVTAAASHPIWTRTLERTLTKEQLQVAKRIEEELMLLRQTEHLQRRIRLQPVDGFMVLPREMRRIDVLQPGFKVIQPPVIRDVLGPVIQPPLPVDR